MEDNRITRETLLSWLKKEHERSKEPRSPVVVHPTYYEEIRKIMEKGS